MILIIDNYDSFVYNLARYVSLEGYEPLVIRNDAKSVATCLALNPEAVILSPGPKTPKNAGICMALLSELSFSTPMLGVCLGHQCLVEHFGGRTIRARYPLHGEATEIVHDANGIFMDMASPTMVGRYHSLISVLSPDDDGLRVTATSKEGEIMAVSHKHAPWFGVQFHPESVLTPQGRTIIRNFISHV